jgi:hypothetical protein
MTTTRTKTIAGHEITLAAGRRYLASRPMASQFQQHFGVKISDITDGIAREVSVQRIGNLSREQANAFLRAFNHGKVSFDGRMW